MKWILIGLPVAVASIFLLLFIGAIFSRMSDEKGKETLRTDGIALINKTIDSFDVGTDKQPGNTYSEFSCNISSDSFGQAPYLTCYITRSATAKLSNNIGQDVANYRNFYDRLLKDGWSNELSIDGPGSGGNTSKVVKSGNELEDTNGIFEINTSKYLKNGVRCSLWSPFYPPDRYEGTVKLLISCDFTGSSETIFNNPTEY